MKILQATKDDLPQILELQKLCFTENAQRYSDFSIPPMVQTNEDIAEEFKTTTFFKAITENIIGGSVRAYEKGSTCFISRLIVYPRYQNRGVGKNLMRTIEAQFSDVKRYEVFTGVEDKKNLYLYNKLGYREFRRDGILVYLEKYNQQ